MRFDLISSEFTAKSIVKKRRKALNRAWIVTSITNRTPSSSPVALYGKLWKLFGSQTTQQTARLFLKYRLPAVDLSYAVLPPYLCSRIVNWFKFVFHHHFWNRHSAVNVRYWFLETIAEERIKIQNEFCWKGIHWPLHCYSISLIRSKKITIQHQPWTLISFWKRNARWTNNTEEATAALSHQCQQCHPCLVEQEAARTTLDSLYWILLLLIVKPITCCWTTETWHSQPKMRHSDR